MLVTIDTKVLENKMQGIISTLLEAYSASQYEADKYKSMYYDNVQNTANLINLLSNGDYCQRQYLNQREINRRLVKENEQLKRLLKINPGEKK